MAASRFPSYNVPLGYRSGYQKDFGQPVITGGNTGNYGNAANMVNIGALYDQEMAGYQPDKIINNHLAEEGQTEAQKIATDYDLLKAIHSRDARMEAANIGREWANKATNESKGIGMAGAGLSAAFKIAPVLLGMGLSDKTTKNTIEAIEDATSKLRALHPVSFYYNEEYSSSPERKHHGFIAQQYKEVLPDATYYDESTQKLCIDTSDVIGILVRGFQELDTRITRIEAKNALLAGVK